MADIQLTCPACGHLQTVSEFVDEPVMSCPACGQAIPMPKRKSGSADLELKRRDVPRSREQAVQADAPGAAVRGPDLPALIAHRSANVARGARWDRTHLLKNWLSALIFLALAGALAYIRFYDGWPGIPLETLKTYGMLAVAVAYLFIIGLALRDNMFDGFLAIVVPLYPFYYLFFVSSAVFIRALVGALLVAFGYDSLLFIQGWFIMGIDAIKHWISTV